MRVRYLIFALLLASLPSLATTRYIAQTAGTVTCNGGSRTAITPATWNATAESPGDISYVCGTITGGLNTSALVLGWNGSAGNPIQINFDTGADLTSPAWNTNGAIDCAGHSFITIDGGTNGKIENTANGDALANHILTGGVETSGGACDNLTVKNLTISNLYIKVEDQNTNFDDAVAITGAANALITNNHVDHAATGIGLFGVSGTANQEISFNTLTFCQHCITVGAGASGNADIIKVHDNDIGGGAYLWDNANNNYHHNAIIVICENSLNPCITNLLIYNNYIHGKWTVTGHTTSMVFFDDYNNPPEGNTSHIRGTLFNNFISMDPADAGTGNGDINMGGEVGMYNNTIMVPSGTNGGPSCAHFWLIPTNLIKNNICVNTGGGLGANFHMAPVAGAGGSNIDYNLYYQMVSGGWDFGAGADTFSQWLADCGCDTHSTNGSDPKLNANGTLQSGSPAIGSGTNLTSLGIAALNADRAGVARPASGAWDIGANQFGVPTSLNESPSSLSFSNQTVSTTSASQTVTITNNTGSTKTLTSEVLQTGTQFAITSNFCGASLTNGSNCAITITFKPLTLGLKNDNLVITSSGTGSPQSVPLSGTGTAVGNPAPTVSVIAPTSGTTAGGTAVTITGTGFLTGATVNLGGTSATGVTVGSGTSITATTPAHSAGAVDVVVTNTDSQTGTLAGGYSYAGGGGGGVPVVGTNSSCSTGSTSCTMTLAVAAGDSAIVVGFTNSIPNTITVSDSNADTFTSTGAQFCEASGNNCQNSWIVNWGTTNAAEVVTVTFSNSVNFNGAGMVQYGGFGGNAVTDKTASVSFSATTALVTGTTATTTTGNEVLVGIFGTNGSGGIVNQGVGWTSERNQALGSPNSLLLIEDKIVSATGTYQATMASATNTVGGGNIVTIKQGGAAQVAPPTNLSVFAIH